MSKIISFHQAQKLTPAEEQRLQQRIDQPRPKTPKEKMMDEWAKDYLKRKGTKS